MIKNQSIQKNIIRYIDTTLYILSHSSLEYEEEIRLIFKNYHRRFTVEITTITINLVEDELEEYKDDDDTNNKLNDFIGLIPIKRDTLAIRRKSYKKPPRPIFLSFIYLSILVLLLLIIIYNTIYILFTT